jgi:class 3 adenylate cyclase
VEASPELQSVVRRWFAAMNRRDADSAVNAFADDPRLLAIGTDPDEWISGFQMQQAIMRAQVKELDEQHVLFEVDHVEAYSEGSVGWVAARYSVRVGDTSAGSMRMTAVFHLERGNWRAVQWHMSAPEENEETLGFEMTTVEHLVAEVQHERPDLRSSAASDGTVTLVFSDIESSTELTMKLGDHAWLDVLRWHDRVVADLTHQHGGRVVKTLGDGHMLAFASASGALHTAIGMQRSFQEPYEGTQLRLRIGLHTGEVLREADDFFGRTVIMAARVSAKANGNEILVSSVVAELTGDSFEFGEPRLTELKGLPGAHQLFPVVWDGLPS